MRKTYTNPELITSGSVVHQTKSGFTSGSELAQPLVKFTM
jgi:hypothetical protein